MLKVVQKQLLRLGFRANLTELEAQLRFHSFADIQSHSQFCSNNLTRFDRLLVSSRFRLLWYCLF